MVVAIVAMPVSADVSNSKIVPIDIVGNLHTSYEFQVGHVQFISRGMNLQDMNIWVQRTDNVTNLTPFDSRYNPDGTEIVGQNPDFLKVALLPDGSDKWTDLVPGVYSWHVAKGDHDQPESGSFTVVAHEYTTVTYLGDARPTIVEKPELSTVPKTTDKICIIGAIYGALYTTGTGRDKHITGKYVDITNQLETLVKDGDTSFTFNVGTVGGNLGDSFTISDPDSGIVKNAIVLYTVDGHLHLQTVMEQDYPSYKGQSTYIPYIVPTHSTVLTLN
jgi:hypothetical protein